VSAGELGVLYARERLTPERIASLSSQEQDGLHWLGRARQYAESIGLVRSKSYRHMIERDADAAVRVVVASPVDRLEPLSWWFPIVGRVTYRGYFDPRRAQRFAQQLADQGYDTYVRPALLYSTLGYFDDPIPRYALRWSPVDLCDVTIHELVHATVFVRSDVAYDEALAVFVAERATLDLLAAENPRAREDAEKVYADDHTYARTLEALAAELRALYAHTRSREEALAGRAAIFAHYRRDVFPAQRWLTDRYAELQKTELSNAFVVAQQTYSSALPCFAHELESLGGDLKAFIARHREQPGHRAAGCETS
jgi:predicted aminopeptidase